MFGIVNEWCPFYKYSQEELLQLKAVLRVNFNGISRKLLNKILRLQMETQDLKKILFSREEVRSLVYCLRNNELSYDNPLLNKLVKRSVDHSVTPTPAPERTLHIYFDGTTNSICDLLHGSTMTTDYHRQQENMSALDDSVYIRGPGSEEKEIKSAILGMLQERFSKYSIDQMVSEAMQIIRENYETPPPGTYDKVIVHGYSRGCLAASQFSHELQRYLQEKEKPDVPVYMTLIDPTTGPNEVKHSYSEQMKRERHQVASNVRELIVFERTLEAEVLDKILNQYQLRCLQKSPITRQNPMQDTNIRRKKIPLRHLELNGLILSGELGDITREDRLAACARRLDRQDVQEFKELFFSVSDAFSVGNLECLNTLVIPNDLQAISVWDSYTSVAAEVAQTIFERIPNMAAYAKDTLSAAAPVVCSAVNQAVTSVASASRNAYSFFITCITNKKMQTTLSMSMIMAFTNHKPAAA